MIRSDVPLKRLASIKARVGWKGLTSDEFEVTSFAYLVTGRDFRGKYIDWSSCYQVARERYEDDPFIQLRDGDLLVTKDGTIGKVALVDQLDKPACLNSGVFVVRPHGELETSYLYWILQSEIFSGFIAEVSRGSTIQHLYQEEFRELRVPLRRAAEQRAIADYLDRETAQIDAFIAKNEELIALLTERRVAAINREFQNQPSNARIGHACESVVDCPHTTPPFDEDGEFEAVRTASVRDGKFRPNQGIRVNRRTWLDRNGSRGPRIGDILFTREAPAGEACMVPSTQICLGQRMVLLRIDPSKAHGDFVLWQLYSHKVATHFERAANGSTVTNIRLPLLRATPIWLPSLDTQSNVLQRLKAVGDKTDAAIATAHSAIELAKERRAALISAAVTGKIDVSREASAV